MTRVTATVADIEEGRIFQHPVLGTPVTASKAASYDALTHSYWVMGTHIHGDIGVPFSGLDSTVEVWV